jgi:glutamate--cysteine ligase
VSSRIEQDRRPIESREQLIEYFREGETTREQRGVGTEHEKFVYRQDDFSMVAHEGRGGLQELFERLVEEFDWIPSFENEWIVELEGPDARVTLEPGGQFELAGAVQETVHGTEAELDEHFRQLDAVAGDDLYFACWGMNPFYSPSEVPLVPKQRYDIMRSYLPSRGGLAPWMMKTSCTVQANYDYIDESDAADIVRTSLLISPLVSALFANSPYRAGEDSEMQSFRGYAWTDTDPDRTGWPRFMYGEDWGYEEYLSYVLEIPMFFVRRNDRLIPKTGHTFREFLEGDRHRSQPIMQDFELHLSTAFPEIRMKQFIEVRGADGGPRAFMLALPALWKGVLYHEPTRRRAAALVDGVDPDAHEEMFMEIYRDGLRAECSVGSVGRLAGELVELAGEGLDALAEAEGYESERPYLEPLERVVETGQTLSDQFRADVESGLGRRGLLEKWSLL